MRAIRSRTPSYDSKEGIALRLYDMWDHHRSGYIEPKLIPLEERFVSAPLRNFMRSRMQDVHFRKFSNTRPMPREFTRVRFHLPSGAEPGRIAMA